MLLLQNHELALEIIDPVADQGVLGSRYCTGGYVFQIKDNKKGRLLSGPTYPDGQYNAFDGQGMPEVFVTALNEDSAQVGEDVLVLGVGLVTRISTKTPFHVRDNPCVKTFCSWKIEQSSARIDMAASHHFDKWDIGLERTIALSGRSVISATRVANTGDADCLVRWFPHPFFPFPENGLACRFCRPVDVPDNPGYFLNNQGFLEMKRDYDWQNGLYQPIVWKEPLAFESVLCHPLCKTVHMRCDYVPSFFPVWANSRTFSVEPYLERRISSGERFSWKIEYVFG